MRRKHKKDLEYIWGSIGYIMHICSMIEQNVKLLISGEELMHHFDKENVSILDFIEAVDTSNKMFRGNTENKVMLGRLIKQLEKYKLYNDSSLIDDLRKASEIRGYYAHEFFKKDLYLKHLESNPRFYEPKLREDIGYLFELNIDLLDIVKKYKKIISTFMVDYK